MGTAFLCLRRSCFDDSPEEQGADEDVVVAYNPPQPPERMFRISRVAAAPSDNETDDDTEDCTSCHRQEGDGNQQQEEELSGLRRFWIKLSDWRNPGYVSLETRGEATTDLSGDACHPRDVETAVEQARSPLRTASKFEDSGGVPSIATEEIVMPGSELQRKMAHCMSKSLEEHGDECVICMEGFDPTNPRMPTLCGCGENKTFFHLPCLYQWIEQSRTCPSCRKRLRWEEL